MLGFVLARMQLLVRLAGLLVGRHGHLDVRLHPLRVEGGAVLDAGFEGRGHVPLVVDGGLPLLGGSTEELARTAVLSILQ